MSGKHLGLWAPSPPGAKISADSLAPGDPGYLVPHHGYLDPRGQDKPAWVSWPPGAQLLMGILSNTLSYSLNGEFTVDKNKTKIL